MTKYIISPVTLYDIDNERWETKIGLNVNNMPLQYSCWGRTEIQSRLMAENLIPILEDIQLTNAC